MNIQEFTDKFTDATRNLSKEETVELLRLFQSLSEDIKKESVSCTSDYKNYKAPHFEGDIDELTPRMKRLR